MYLSKKSKAIAVLTRLKNRYNDADTGIMGFIAETDYWLQNTADVIEKYIGTDSRLRQACLELINMQIEMKNLYIEGNPIQNQKAELFKPEALIDECIEHIKDNGVYRGKGNNFLGTLSNGELLTLLSTILIALFGGAFSIGASFTYFNQSTKSESKSTIKTNKDSLQNEQKIVYRKLHTPKTSVKK